MRCQPRLQRLDVRHRGVLLRLPCCKTICTSTSLVMHGLHTISNAAL
jgi:hypothetical protein